MVMEERIKKKCLNLFLKEVYETNDIIVFKNMRNSCKVIVKDKDEYNLVDKILNALNQKYADLLLKRFGGESTISNDEVVEYIVSMYKYGLKINNIEKLNKIVLQYIDKSYSKNKIDNLSHLLNILNENNNRNIKEYKKIRINYKLKEDISLVLLKKYLFSTKEEVIKEQSLVILNNYYNILSSSNKKIAINAIEELLLECLSYYAFDRSKYFYVERRFYSMLDNAEKEKVRTKEGFLSNVQVEQLGSQKIIAELDINKIEKRFNQLMEDQNKKFWQLSEKNKNNKSMKIAVEMRKERELKNAILAMNQLKEISNQAITDKAIKNVKVANQTNRKIRKI